MVPRLVAPHGTVVDVSGREAIRLMRQGWTREVVVETETEDEDEE